MEDMQHAMSVPSITAKSNRTSGGYDWDHDFTVVYLCHVVIVEFVRGALHLLHRQIVQHYTTETAFAVQGHYCPSIAARCAIANDGPQGFKHAMRLGAHLGRRVCAQDCRLAVVKHLQTLRLRV
eukprot:2207847-Rhodomonas_salina.1